MVADKIFKLIIDLKFINFEGMLYLQFEGLLSLSNQGANFYGHSFALMFVGGPNLSAAGKGFQK